MNSAPFFSFRLSAHRPWAGLAASALLAASFPAAQAQTSPPDAGSLRQQIEQQREAPMPAPSRPARPAPLPPESRPAGSLAAQAKAFRFAGNALLSSEQLAPAVAAFLNRPLSFEDLQRAADAVAAAYREAGWLARVFLPEQDVSEGLVTLQVVESRYAGLRVEGLPPVLVAQPEVEAFINSSQTVGQPLAANVLDRGLLLADDLPGVSVAGTLEPGKADGDTALVLQVTDEPFVYGDVGLDNTGSRSTGANRLTASLNVNSPGGRGELFSTYLLHTQGSDYARASLTVPVGYDGLRLGVNISDMRYKTVVGPSVKGSSDGVGGDMSYPLLRSRLQNIYLSGGADVKNFFNQVLSADAPPQVQGDYKTAAARLGLSGNWFDGLGGGGANSASVQGLWGRLKDMVKHPGEGSILPNYHKLTYSLSRQQSVNEAHSVLVSLAGQHSSQVLDSSERFYLGGAGSVRAYPSSEQGGDSGQLLTGEWRWRVDSQWVATAFVDMGRVKSNAIVTSGPTGAVYLYGRGLALSWRGPAGLSAKVVWAHRNGENPRPNLGNDSDGTLTKNRVWINLGMPF